MFTKTLGVAGHIGFTQTRPVRNEEESSERRERKRCNALNTNSSTNKKHDNIDGNVHAHLGWRLMLLKSTAGNGSFKSLLSGDVAVLRLDDEPESC